MCRVCPFLGLRRKFLRRRWHISDLLVYEVGIAVFDVRISPIKRMLLRRVRRRGHAHSETPTESEGLCK